MYNLFVQFVINSTYYTASNDSENKIYTIIHTHYVTIILLAIKICIQCICEINKLQDK